LKRVGAWYIEQLASPDAAAARQYLEERGFDKDTILSFGLGWAPSSGRGLVDWARAEKLEFKDLDKLGLARRNERGPYDFFRGRLMFPIRDMRGRTVGFGARRLSDGENAGPKYVNSTESPWFQKGTLVYGLDLATPEARKRRHLVLVEGYTDVMAAHQKGLKNTAAVLGTATTERHAKVLRRVGVDRISLVFDGDPAGQKAAYKALDGLLPQDFNLDVVQPPGGQDPCDVLMSEGLAPFEEALKNAQAWLDYSCNGLQGLHGSELSKAVDQVLALFLRIKAPVHREDLLRQLAERLGYKVETLRAQMALTPEARIAVRDAERKRHEAASAPLQAEVPAPEEDGALPERVRVSPRVRRAWGQIAGALLLDPSLVPIAAPWAKRCEIEDIQRVLEAILELHADIDADITPGTVMTVLVGHPAREIVGKIVQHSESAESPRLLLDDAISFLKRIQLEAERATIQARLSDSNIDDSEQKELLQRFMAIQEELRKIQTTTGALASSH
jgi:DNA primase catalytic core